MIIKRVGDRQGRHAGRKTDNGHCQTDRRTGSHTDRNAWLRTGRVGMVEGRKTENGQTDRQTEGQTVRLTEMRGSGQAG